LKIIQNNTLKALALCAGFFSLLACKESSIIKPDLAPGIDNINTFRLTADSLPIELRIASQDSLRTDDAVTPIMALGSIGDDPFFGTTDAGIYMQVAPNVDNFAFPDSMATMDSAVLVLPYTGISYGDTSVTNVQSLKVYRITQNDFKLDGTDRKYYSFDSVTVDRSNPLASVAVNYAQISTEGTVYPSGDTLKNQLRIRLSDAFANEMATAGEDVYKNFSSFIDYFKGVYIAPNPDAPMAQKQRLSYFYLGVSSSSNYEKARIEFHYTTVNGAKRVAFFTHNPISSAFFCSIRRNRMGTPSANYVGAPEVLRDSLIIQGTPGFRTEVTIKNIQRIPESVVLKAELLFNVLRVGKDDIYTMPRQIIPVGVNSDSTTYTIADLKNFNGEETSETRFFVDGTPKPVTIDGVQYIQYKINFPRELQQAKIDGKDELKIRLISSEVLPAAFRMVAPGTKGASDVRMQLDVIYSKK
jgi:hypothetical protein